MWGIRLIRSGVTSEQGGEGEFIRACRYIRERREGGILFLKYSFYAPENFLHFRFFFFAPYSMYACFPYVFAE